MKGFHCSVVEIVNEMAKIVQDTLHSWGFNKIEINKGSNRSLSYKTFNYLISNNVIHYESNGNDYINVLKEYVRLLNLGGAIFNDSCPRAWNLQKTKISGVHTFKMQNWDFLDEESLFYLWNQKYLEF